MERVEFEENGREISEVDGKRGRGLLEVASDDDGSVTRLWVRDGDAVSWERDGCGPSSARSLDGGGRSVRWCLFLEFLYRIIVHGRGVLQNTGDLL